MLSISNPIRSSSSSNYNIVEEVRTSYGQLKKMILGSGDGCDIFIGYIWKLFRNYKANKEMVSKLYLFVDEMGEGGSGVADGSGSGGIMHIGLVEKLIICSLLLMEIGKTHLSSSFFLRLEDVLGNVTMEFSLHYSTVSEVPPYFIKVLNEMKDRFDSYIEELDLLLENFNSSAESDSPHHLLPPPPPQKQQHHHQQFTNTSLTSMSAIPNTNTTNTNTFLQFKRRRNDSVFSPSILSDGRCYQLDVNTNDFYQRPMSQPIPIKSTLKKKKKVDRTIILMTPPHIRKCDIVRWTMDTENGRREDQKIEHKMNNLELADCVEDRIERDKHEQHEDEDECFKILG